MYEGILQLVPDSPPNSRILRIGLLGLPGVGKSTLVNRLALFQACATSKKVNTTRSKQNVAYTQGDTQLVSKRFPKCFFYSSLLFFYFAFALDFAQKALSELQHVHVFEEGTQQHTIFTSADPVLRLTKVSQSPRSSSEVRAEPTRRRVIIRAF